MSFSTHYKVRVTRRGSPGLPFGWELCRRDNEQEVERSPDTYRSRHEALAEGERAAVDRDRRDGAPVAASA